jgi:catechol 2,3-dioxygenase
VPLTGASDHDVSEAIYLDDPEGNGVEVYSDRPREKWRRDGELIFQKTDPLDIEAIIREIDPATATHRPYPSFAILARVIAVPDVDSHVVVIAAGG